MGPKEWKLCKSSVVCISDFVRHREVTANLMQWHTGDTSPAIHRLTLESSLIAPGGACLPACLLLLQPLVLHPDYAHSTTSHSFLTFDRESCLTITIQLS